MYKLLKTYKNLENHNIKTQVSSIVRMEERAVVLTFYPKNSIKENNLNFCPIEQQDYPFNSFNVKEFVEWCNTEDRGKELLSILHPNFWMIGKSFKLPIKDTLLNFEPNLVGYFFNKVALKYYLNLYKKYFIRLERKYRIEILNKVKVIFLNKNIHQLINSYNIVQSPYKTLYKNFLRKCLILVFLKEKINRKNFFKSLFKNKFKIKNLKETIEKKKIFKLFLCFNSRNWKGCIFKIPGILESFYLPNKWIFRNFFSYKKKNKYMNDILNSFFKRYKYSFFKLNFSFINFLNKKGKHFKIIVNVFNKQSFKTFSRIKSKIKPKIKPKFNKKFKKAKVEKHFKLKIHNKKNISLPIPFKKNNNFNQSKKSISKISPKHLSK